MVAAHARALLVPTKLIPPRPRTPWVRRDRLLARLRAADAARLTLVIAPAGFGKSTLIAQWLAQPSGPQPIPVAWLTLDEHDQDGLRFLVYLAEAIERAAPGALATARPLLAAPEPPPPYVIIQALLVDLSALPGQLYVVLDDYHAVTAEPVHQLLAYLLRHLPPQCRLVLLSRVDPPLPLARLRAERQLVEVRAADLRFTPPEAAGLLASLLGAEPAPDLAAALHQQTEGWAIALQLAALARQEGRAPRLPGGASRQIADYLADEVFARQPDEVRQTLLALAVPERFCAGLCAALLGAPDDLILAESRLERLLRANLFVIALDAEGRWFRFHHLFRDLLLRRLRLDASPAEARALNLLAAEWLAAEGLAEEAVRHYLAAGAEDSAAELVERQLMPEMGNDVAAVPPGVWLRLLPPALVARRPGLGLILARMSVFSMDMADFQTRLAHVDALLARPEAAGAAPPWPSFHADLTALRGVLAYWQGRPAETIAHMRVALAQGPTLALAIQALLQLGVAYVASGAYAEGVRLLEGGLPEAVARLGDQYPLYQHSCLSGMHQLAGELAAQEEAARRLAVEVELRAPGDLWVGYVAVALGIAAYERSDLAAATTQFGVLATRKYKVSYPGYMTGVTGLALVAAARGAFDDAALYLREARAFADEAGGAFLRHQALACAARVALARGDAAEALAASAGIVRDIHLGLTVALDAPRLTRAEALIAAGGQADLERAEALLAECVAEIEPLHHTRLQIRALATQALLRQAQGRPDEALAALTCAVGLAEPRGFVRTFVDLGPAAQPLLRALLARGHAPAYLEGVLAAFTPTATPHERLAPPLSPSGLPELLTRRELEILALLGERWSDKEIAERLVIAPNTVRKHTSTIYDKLGVSSRREAVEAARALGLLPAA